MPKAHAALKQAQKRQKGQKQRRKQHSKRRDSALIPQEAHLGQSACSEIQPKSARVVHSATERDASSDIEHLRNTCASVCGSGLEQSRQVANFRRAENPKQASSNRCVSSSRSHVAVDHTLCWPGSRFSTAVNVQNLVLIARPRTKPTRLGTGRPQNKTFNGTWRTRIETIYRILR